jgi:hypothetical protein
MKKIVLILLTGLISLFSFAQEIDKVINAAEVERIERILAADDMQGRKTFTPGIDKAADFIAAEFSKHKELKFFGKNNSWFQEFSLVKAKNISATIKLNNENIPAANYIISTTSASIDVNSADGWKVIQIKKDDDYSKGIQAALEEEKNLLVVIDTAHANRFKRLKNFFGRAKFADPYSQIFILAPSSTVSNIEIRATNELTEQHLKNVVAVLPGKGKKKQSVIFSGHYDHLGIGRPNANKDSLYNGANDDAAGITAVMMLADYFSQLKNNKRTIIFVAFTAEEIGGFGSQYFSKQLKPKKVKAMFNIEMIGTESKWGTNSTYITGYEKSDFGKILQNNVSGTVFRFEPDPYPEQKLFYRSDNARLAKLGVPAHTISTSKMDSEKYYHTPEDEIETLNMKNMAEIIKAIALSSTTIVSGKDTPTRIKE